jgi:hypothetical protein
MFAWQRSALSIAILALTTLALTGAASAAGPVVTNVRLQQDSDGSGTVRILYDLADPDSPAVRTTLQLSDDGGQTFEFPVLHVSGDVGPGIAPGNDRQILWHAGDLAVPLDLGSVVARVVASDAGVDFAVHSPALVAITDGSSVNWADPAVVEKFSRADLCIVMANHLWAGGAHESRNVIAQLKALNPDIVMIGYVSAKTALIDGPNGPPDSYWYKWYNRTSPYFVYTTTGDVAQDWPISRLINILEPGCRRAMIETIMEQQAISLNKFDGIMWDYFNRELWVSPQVTATGDPDMDGDGIGHWDDPDELQAYRDAQISLVTAARDSLGENFIQIFNGQRAYGDPAFAALADGAFYELFPTLFFPAPNMANALDPQYPYSLFNARNWFRSDNGGPYLILSSVWNTLYSDDQGIPTQIITGDQFRAVSLLTGAYASWNTNANGSRDPVYNWTPRDVTMGAPLGEPVFAGNIIRREFEYGRLELRMLSGSYPNPFSYWIWSLGEVVSRLDAPYHTP